MTTGAADPNDPGKSGGPRESKVFTFGVFGFALIVFLGIGFGLYQSNGKFLLQLQEAAVSRGLITFLVAVVTVSIAFVTAVWVLTSNEDADTIKARFSYAKDVLSTLVGILGTVLGFYFGSADKSVTEQLNLAELQFKAGQIVTHASGGTAPYRYTVTPADGDPKSSTHVSKDGWIFEQVPASIKADGTVTVMIAVVDSKDRKASQSRKYEAESGGVLNKAAPPPQQAIQDSGRAQAPAKPASK